MKILDQPLSKAELDRHLGDPSQAYGVDLVTLSDGPERGNRVLQFRSGSGMSFDVMVDRAMDLARISYRGLPIGWHSGAGFRSPWLHEHDAEDGFGWFRSMSGLINTCGLDHVHAPERDSAADFHHPPRPEIQHGLHGRIAYTPARLTAYGLSEDVLFAEGEIRQATVFGENLVLERRIEVDLGGDTIRYHDCVRNRGFDPTPHALLWHINIGWPLLSENAELWADILETPWQLRDDLPGEYGPRRQASPMHPTTQQVFDHRLVTDSFGTARAALANPRLHYGSDRGLALEIAYDGVAMPSLFQWQHFQSGNYVVALEPCTTHAGNRRSWRDRCELRVLSHGEVARYRLSLTPHLGASALSELSKRFG